MKQPKNYLLIALSAVILFMLLQKGCTTEVKPKDIYRIDTLTTTRVDTINVPSVKYAFKTITKFVPTLTIPDTGTMRQIAQNTYSDSICDSRECLYYKIGVIGELNSLDLAYKVRSHDSLFTTITKTIVKPEYIPTKLSVYLGFEAGGNLNSFEMSPYLTVNYKRLGLGFRYGVIERTYNIGVSYKLFNSKK